MSPSTSQQQQQQSPQPSPFIIETTTTTIELVKYHLLIQLQSETTPTTAAECNGSCSGHRRILRTAAENASAEEHRTRAAVQSSHGTNQGA